MKRILLLALLASGISGLFSLSSLAQTSQAQCKLDQSTSTGCVTNLRNSGVNQHIFVWKTTGTVSAGACALVGGTDGVTFGSTVIAAQTVTSSGGLTTLATSNQPYIEINCTTPITGTGSVQVNYFGFAPFTAANPAVSVTGGNAAASATGSAVPPQASYTAASVGGTLTGLTATNNGGKISIDANITGGSTGNGAASNTGSAVPVQAGYTGGNLAGNLVGIAAYTDSGSNGLGVHVANTVTANATLQTQTDTVMVGGVNIKEINAVTPLMGNGTTGTGSQRVTIASDNTAFSVNPVSATVPVVTMNSASANNGLNSAVALVFDDAAPTSITENNFGFARMSANRNAYSTIRDAAGNERGVNVNASNQMSISLDGDTLSTARGASVTEPPILNGCEYLSGPSAVSNGQKVTTLCDTLGNALSAASPSPDAITAASACYVKSGTGTLNDTTNHANCKASAGNLYGVRAINTSATLAYLKLYNLTTDPTCSSATGFIESIPIPAQATGAGFIDPANLAINYTTGIGYCVTGAGANTDNSAPPAGVYITLKYK
jgi:hypothetical protein